MATKTAKTDKAPLMLNLGCGTKKEPGYLGVDILKLEGVDMVLDLDSDKPWPWKAGSVESIKCDHLLEYIPGARRPHFLNECYRVLKVGGQARFLVGAWCHEKSYADPLVQWPPVSSTFFLLLKKEIRTAFFPHLNEVYTCDFDVTPMITWDNSDAYIAFRNDQEKAQLMQRNINSAIDLIATLTKCPPPEPILKVVPPKK